MAVVDCIDNEVYLAFRQIITVPVLFTQEPVAVTNSIDNRGVYGVCIGSTSGCGGQF